MKNFKGSMNTNWEEYRKTAAMAAMQALLQNTNYVSDKTKSCYTVTEMADSTAYDAIAFADALVKKLKQEH